jgi:hypothetical protein
MAKTVTIEISDNIYASLMKVAAQIGQTPEQIILYWIENQIEPATKDPLLALAGVFEAPVTDIGEQHDDYIGASIKDDHA